MKFVQDYFEKLNRNLLEINEFKSAISETIDFLFQTNRNGGKVIFMGNGGSAAIASHAAVDLTKVGKLRAINFNESNLITCYANDYGYENWLYEALTSHADKKDLIILISSSGESRNIINAATWSIENNINTVTFSGFSSTNRLRNLGNTNFYVNSNSYNHVEITHLAWILSIIDMYSNKRNQV